jgi:hypothetical protein
MSIIELKKKTVVLNKTIEKQLNKLHNKIIELDIEISNIKNEKMIYNNTDQRKLAVNLNLVINEKEAHKKSIQDMIDFLS